MRTLLLAVLSVLLVSQVASAADEQDRQASFTMARGFDDRMSVVSGGMDLATTASTGSAGFFHVSEVTVEGLSKACWQTLVAGPVDCVDGALSVAITSGSSFGFSSLNGYEVNAVADHALASFVDLSQADGFDSRLHVGPSIISSLVGGDVEFGRIPALSAAEPGALNILEAGGTLRVIGPAGTTLHTAKFDDPPMLVEGTPRFDRPFGADVIVVPFDAGANAQFIPADEGDAKIGMSPERLELLDTILRNVRLIGPDATASPIAIVEKADDVLSEVFNGAVLRTSLEEDPNSLGDVGFAKFNDLTVSDGTGRSLDFEGSYTLVVGDLGPSFGNTVVSQESQPLRWWVGAFLLIAVVVVGAWLWLRDGPVQHAAPGPHTWVARIATSVGVLATFLIWDWQLNKVLGSSMLTTSGSGTGLGLIILVELASLALAALLIGVPVFLAVRYGLALAKKPRHASLAVTAGVFFTLAFGVLLLPALVSFILGLAA
ncbi:MAG TPA: hypothetical protein VM327_02080 [Candidatus Thermoplasmatota archaeon]|nr:hypothetical protein [Candidatus Thermoplasmatota archaeon]